MAEALKKVPEQKQEEQPGREFRMTPEPEIVSPSYKPAGKLEGKVALITGGDSGIGRSVAVHYALEGADVAIVYLEEHEDARKTQRMVEERGRKCLLIPGDVGKESFCFEAVEETVRELGRLDILVNNAGEQHPQESLEKITAEQLERTFRTNIFGYFYMAKAALKHLGKDGVILNTSSVTAYKGSSHLLDYSATKGAIVAFTRSLSQALEEREIRVNAVAPGPIWTPLIPSTFTREHVGKFGQNYPMGRPGQPSEVAPCYVFLASSDASYMSGQTLHPNGGAIVQS